MCTSKMLGFCSFSLAVMLLLSTVQARQPYIHQQQQLQQKQAALTFWQFTHRVVEQFVQPSAMKQVELGTRLLVVELGNAYGSNATSRNSADETGELFQAWMEEVFDGAYVWAQDSENKEYAKMSNDFKLLRDWFVGLREFRFTEQHVKVFADFYRDFADKNPNRIFPPIAIYKAFKKHVQHTPSAALSRVRRQVPSAVVLDASMRALFSQSSSNATGFWALIDYIEDALVAYNRIQGMLWPIKMAVSFIAPPIKFIWTFVDVAACLAEEFYELKIADHTEERWWDPFLCALELLGVIPGAGALKFGLRILIRSLKIYTGIHSVPWYITTSGYVSMWEKMKAWRWGATSLAPVMTTTPMYFVYSNITTPAATAGTTVAAIIQAPATTTQKPVKPPGTEDDAFNWGNKNSGGILGTFKQL